MRTLTWLMACVYVLGMVDPVPLQAQTAGAEVVVQRVVEADVRDVNKRPALQLTVTYSLVNRADQTVVNADDIASSRLRLKPNTVDVEQVDATPDEPVKPESWSIVLLTDLSRPSDQTDFKTLTDARAALAKRLNSGPAANYAWFDFNRTSIPRQINFQLLENNNDKGLTKDLSTARSTAEPSSCLNKALSEAIQKLQTVSGRKAILVLTHQTDTCAGQSSEAEVIQSATAGDVTRRVQIFAMGVGNDPLKLALRRLTEATGGSSIVADSAQTIDPGIQQMLQLMKNQREAVFTLYPDKGDGQKGELTVLLKTNTSKSVPIVFNSPAKYTPPPAIAFENAVPSAEGMRVILKGRNPEGFSRFTVELTDRNTGTTNSRTFENPASTFKGGLFTVLLSRGQDVQDGGQYSLQIGLETIEGVKSKLFADRPFEFSYTVQPPKIGFVGDPIAPSPRAPTFVLTVTSSVDNVYADVWIEAFGQQESGKALLGKPLVLLFKDQPQQLAFSAGDLPQGDYVAKMRLSSTPDEPISSRVLVYRKGDIFTNLNQYVQENPWFAAVLALIAVAAVAGLVVIGWIVHSRSTARVRIAREGLRANMRRIDIRVQETGSLVSKEGSIGHPAAAGHGREDAAHGVDPSGSASRAPSASGQVPASERPASGMHDRPSVGPASDASPSPGPTVPGSTVIPATISAVQPTDLKFGGKVRKTPFTIGRDPANDGTLAVDGTSGVSRRHITLIFEAGRWYVRDENTSNGTRLNGTRITSGTLVPLEAVSRLTLGTTVELEFRVVQ